MFNVGNSQDCPAKTFYRVYVYMYIVSIPAFLCDVIFKMAVVPKSQRLFVIECFDDEHDEVVIAAAMVRRQQRNEQRRRRYWVRPWIERRHLYGQYDTLFAELDRESGGDYMSYIRMDRNTFAEILQRVGPRITKSDK